MNRATLEELAKFHGAPAVSILCSLDTRRPGNTHDPALLENLRDRASQRVRETVSDPAAEAVMNRVDDALASLDLAHPTPGVALFISPDASRVVPLDSAVDPEVVVGERFAIRGVLSSFLRSPRARALVLSQTKTRCIDLTGTRSTERFDFGFPLEVSAPVEADTPHRDFPLDEHEHAEASKFVFRAVDRALGPLQRDDTRPLVLLGAVRDLAYFDEITEHRGQIVRRVHGDYEHETVSKIADLVLPVVDAFRRDRERQACDEVREAVGRRAVAGIGETWEAARAGRGHRLVVEESLRYPARAAGDTLTPTSTDDPEAFDAVEDTVREVIRHGGEVIVVPSDSLVDAGRVALFTRYS